MTLISEAMIESLDACMVFVLDREGRIEAANRSARAVAPTPTDAAAWFKSDAFRRPEHGTSEDDGADPLATLLHGERRGPVHFLRSRDPDGEAMYEFRIGDPDGDGRRLLTATDVTAVHVLQTELRELRQLGQRDGTTAEVAHGLGNVFGIIQMACETILDASLAEQVRAKVNDMREAGLRGTALTGRLLGHVFEDEPAVPSTELIGVLRTTTKLIGRILPADVTLDVTLPETEHYVAIGHGPLEAALIKLLSVARRAVVGSGGTIRVTAKATGDRVEIEMSEDRSGASTAETVAYSDRTQALGTHDDSVAEVGNLLDGVGGQLTERSLSKGGRLFRLSLPYTSSAGEADGAASMRSDARLAGYRILLAESDGPLRSLLTEALRQMGGVVAVVDSGARAIECLTEDRVPDIVISNRSFTDGTTLADLAARARRSPGKAPRFVILSAVPDPSDAELEGAVHLRKPVNLSALAEAIFSSPPGAGRSDTTGDQGTSQASDA